MMFAFIIVCIDHDDDDDDDHEFIMFFFLPCNLPPFFSPSFATFLFLQIPLVVIVVWFIYQGKAILRCSF